MRTSNQALLWACAVKLAVSHEVVTALVYTKRVCRQRGNNPWSGHSFGSYKESVQKKWQYHEVVTTLVPTKRVCRKSGNIMRWSQFWFVPTECIVKVATVHEVITSLVLTKTVCSKSDNIMRYSKLWFLPRDCELNAAISCGLISASSRFLSFSRCWHLSA